jgi:hypothetical protein
MLCETGSLPSVTCVSFKREGSTAKCRCTRKRFWDGITWLSTHKIPSRPHCTRWPRSGHTASVFPTSGVPIEWQVTGVLWTWFKGKTFSSITRQWTERCWNECMERCMQSTSCSVPFPTCLWCSTLHRWVCYLPECAFSKHCLLG